MTQKNDAPILIVSLLVTLGLLGAGAWWLYRTFNTDTPISVSLPPSLPLGSSQGNLVVSEGETLILTDTASAEKQAAIAAIASADYATATQALETSLQANRNDPEALIYLNNARIGAAQAYDIAVVVPSPAVDDASAELLRGVAHAQQDINQSGGLGGTPVRVLIATDNNNRDQAQAVAQFLSQRATLMGVVGHFSSEASLAAAAVYNANTVVMISPTSTAVTLSGAGEYVYRTVQSDRVAADGLARHMIEVMGIQSVAIAYTANSDYSRSFKDAFSSAVLTGGGRVISEIDVSDAGFDATASLSQMAQQGAEGLVLATNSSTREQALALITANRGQLAIAGGDSLYNAATLVQGQANAVGMVVAAPWHRDGSPGAAFPTEAQALWGGPVSWRTAMAYDAVQSLAQAIRLAAPSANPLASSEATQQVLAQPGFTAPGATESVQFLPSGDRSLPIELVTITADPASEFGYSFVPLP